MESNNSKDIINKLREDERVYRTQLDNCKADLQKAKSNIEKWNSVASKMLPEGYKTTEEVADSLKKQRSSVDDLKELLKKKKRTETALITAIHLKDEKIIELKSEFQNIKKQLMNNDRSMQNSSKSLVLDPVMHEDFESLKRNSEATSKMALELEEAAKLTKPNVLGKVLLEKCRTYQKENEEFAVIYDNISDLNMKIAQETLRGVEIKSQFNALYQHINDLLFKLERSNRQISHMQLQIQIKEYQISQYK